MPSREKEILAIPRGEFTLKGRKVTLDNLIHRCSSCGRDTDGLPVDLKFENVTPGHGYVYLFCEDCRA